MDKLEKLLTAAVAVEPGDLASFMHDDKGWERSNGRTERVAGGAERVEVDHFQPEVRVRDRTVRASQHVGSETQASGAVSRFEHHQPVALSGPAIIAGPAHGQGRGRQKSERKYQKLTHNPVIHPPGPRRNSLRVTKSIS